MQTAFEREIDQNFQFFQGFVASLLPEKFGQFALLRARKVIGVYPRVADAMVAGHGSFADGIFSVQKVTDRPLDLGFLSHASDDRITA
jgi:hypothetical protein